MSLTSRQQEKCLILKTVGKLIYIIAMLEKQHQLNLDQHLSAEQKAIACAFIRLCEDSLYWAGLYSRWVDKDNYSWKKEFIGSTKLPKAM